MNGYLSQCEYCGQLISWDRWRDYLVREGVWDGRERLHDI